MRPEEEKPTHLQPADVTLSIDSFNSNSHLISLNELLVTSYYQLSIEYMLQRKVIEAEAELQRAKVLARNTLTPAHSLYQQLFQPRPSKSTERRMKAGMLVGKGRSPSKPELAQTSRSPTSIYT